MSETFCFSTDNEFFSGSATSREDALADAINENDPESGRVVYTGISVPYSIREFIPNGEHIIDAMRDRACDEADEFADGWLDTVTKEQEAELHALMIQAVEGWADKNNLNPTFYRVRDIEEHQIPAVAAEAAQTI
jgi:hypothetical protein